MTRLGALGALAVLGVACGGGSEDAVDARVGIDGAPLDASAVDGGEGECTAPSFTSVDPATTDELTLANDTGSTLGIFDPSIVYPAGAPAGAISYSTVPAQNAILSRIAVSADAGATWTRVADATSPTAVELASTDAIRCPGGTCTGNLVDETSSLIIDLDDPDADRRWKLFTFRYLVSGTNTLNYDYGVIARYTAPAPEGPWSAPTKLIGWRSSTSYSSTDVALDASTVPELADCIAIAEPGALWVPGISIDLAVGCVYLEGGTTRIRTELLRSTDHGDTFVHVARLLDGTDAPCLGGVDPRLNAPSLFSVGDTAYLSITPDIEDVGYQGCAVIAFDDLGAGTLQRDPGTGAPVVVRGFRAPAGRFTGACAYAEGATAAGMLVPIAFIDDPPRIFRIFASGLTVP